MIVDPFFTLFIGGLIMMAGYAVRQLLSIHMSVVWAELIAIPVTVALLLAVSYGISPADRPVAGDHRPVGTQPLPMP